MGVVFDRDFDTEIEQERAERRRLERACYTPEDLEAAMVRARQEGFDAGRRVGKAEAEATAAESDQRRQSEAVEAVATHVDDLMRGMDRHVATLERQVLTFVLAVFEKIFPEVMSGRGAARAEAEAQSALELALGTSSLQIFLPPEEREGMGQRLELAARELGHEGRVEVLGDPSLKPGDARIEWDNGFMQYSFDLICNRILTALRAASLLPEAHDDEPAETQAQISHEE